ncbi:MAG: hypothetical protein DMF63_03490 [Acidobacteria bacterium]|nr:MAG: hypothetical protein DMF63_03490 [Acidobacteriota bacterium]
MIISKLKSRTIVVLFALAATSAASFYFFQTKSSAAGFNGSIFTTTFDGQTVNANIYSSKDAVYLSGGPQNENASGLPDGTYYFQVTDPSGATLLSTDAAECRQLVVFMGRVAAAEGPSCQHFTGIPNSANGSTPIKLSPFNDTPNSGSQYKVWLIRQGSNTTVASDGMHLNFSPSNAKTDNFKVVFVACGNCTPTSLLGGRKFYDANGNALYDDGEPLLEGVQILVIAGATTQVVTTDASGNWSLAIPTGSEYFVIEFLPFTGAEGEPGSFWNQTAPVAGAEGFQGYIGTANGDQTGLNFGNVCYVLDSQGNPVVATSPCDVSYTPPPDPTPTPAPTPCPDCSPTSVISGTKFYDANRNGSFEPGEVPVANVQIVVVLSSSDGVVVTGATTDESGNWSLVVPFGATYLISEYVPDTDPEQEPGSFWEQTAPAADDEGFRGYRGTLNGDQSGFNFGDICFNVDTNGNPVASSVPCTVHYPPPLPTPTPTPDNQ